MAVPARQDGPLRIAFSVPGLQSPLVAHLMTVARAKAAEMNVELIELDGQDDPATQAAGIESMIGQDVGGFLVLPGDAAALAPAIQAAIDVGIPVVTVDRNLTSATTLAQVGANDVRGGEQQAEYLMRLLPDGGKIIVLQGSAGASAALDRDAGLKRALDGHPEYDIVFDQSAGSTRDQGRTVAEQALQANPDANAIVAANDELALGAADAVVAAGLDIPIIGFDAVPDALQAVQAGTLAATIEPWPGRQVTGALQILVDSIRNGTSPAEHDIFIEPTLITAENVGGAERASEAGIFPVASPVASPVTVSAFTIPAFEMAILRRE
jgi:ABC-type sugar transport system substrate-binding protein